MRSWAAPKLGVFLKVGKGEELTECVADSVLCDTVEAVYGAVFLDGGFSAAQPIIAQLPEWDKSTAKDAKRRCRTLPAAH